MVTLIVGLPTAGAAAVKRPRILLASDRRSAFAYPSVPPLNDASAAQIFPMLLTACLRTELGTHVPVFADRSAARGTEATLPLL